MSLLLDITIWTNPYNYERKPIVTMNALYDVGIAALPRHRPKNGLERTLLAIYRASTLCCRSLAVCTANIMGLYY